MYVIWTPIALAVFSICFCNPARAQQPLRALAFQTSDRHDHTKLSFSDRASGVNTIRQPGPDTADFPDSAFVVMPGGVYVETSFNYLQMRGAALREYFTSTLLRVGVVPGCELRITVPDLIIQHTPADSVVGFGPITLGTKIHLWDEAKRFGLPAAGIIAQLTLQTGSATFQPETLEPGLFLNLDHSFPLEMEFEWNIGITWSSENPDHRFAPQMVFLWAITKEIGEDMSLFAHGLMIGPIASGQPVEIVIGPGLLWFLSDRLAFDFSYNFGLSSETPKRLVRLGLSLAF